MRDAASPLVAPHVLARDGLLMRLAALAPGERLTLIGVDADDIRAAVEEATAAPRMLILDLAGTASATQAVQRILDDLAALALALWPDWGDAPGTTGVLARWRTAAARLAAAGRPPRFKDVAPRAELTQLLLALDPAGLVLVAPLDPAGLPAGRIAALEWCAAAGARIAMLCPRRPPAIAPFDRILYGALDIAPAPAPTPVLERLIVPQGKAHGGSLCEKRLQEAVLADALLAPLFSYNTLVTTTVPGFAARVDLLWAEGRIVVEIDGPEHQGTPKFADDRHRDYELLVAGYLVLRMTNAQVTTDLACALDKIRQVVRFRQAQGDFA